MAKVLPIYNREFNHIKNFLSLSAGIFTINAGMRSGNDKGNAKIN